MNLLLLFLHIYATIPDIRMNDFQVVTLFTIRDGAPCPPIKVKVHFLKKSDWGYESVNTADTLIRAKDDADNMKVALLSQYKKSGFKGDRPPAAKSIENKTAPHREVHSIDENESVSDLFN